MTNEQKYKTAEERNRAFGEWCFNRDCESCKLKANNFDGGDGCRFYWLDLEAEEEGPEPCPFCGGETHINLGHLASRNREVAELRECLREAVTEVCNRLEKCGFKEPCVFKTCYVQKWRKALQDEGGAK